MTFLKTTFVIAALCTSAAMPAFAQDAAAFDPKGTFVDSYGTSFTFSLCGDGTDLCGTLETLKGASATEENLAFVGKQVMQAKASGPNEWKGALTAGGISAEATVTQTGPDTIDIQGCRAAILCQTLTYNRS
ncbi:hypothetical protein SAMN05428969_0202 [Devosia sp. YR412]|uniref:hypothetical protein n=1 Tax=Devosia sp. YR412 TaxID=1881030 RepID=UPI0008C316CC|nr:hypothetical protein [Devosia sp. YR412]SEP62760.1 hypothetical protein SAMN05428969_0202 [Devosia sp. YR412]